MQPGDYSDTLRSVGWFLDMVSAHTIEVALFEEGVATSFGVDGRQEMRKCGVAEAEGLRSTARLFRGLDTGGASTRMSRTLRTLGRDLDLMGARAFTITEAPDHFELLAVADGRAQRRTYARTELQQRAAQLVATRAAQC